ncbi:hypothetical protein ACIA8K_02530 [Catenuloplanes sp. NPDC051500]|uniref:hypothetical protein n=1 Tax=Catenuloplanes sp. NPDC051500 TaxID=3363959 RepID=UPI0037BE023D
MLQNSEMILALHRSREADLMRAARADALAAHVRRARTGRWHPRRPGPAPTQA